MQTKNALDIVAASVKREIRASGYPNVPSVSSDQRKELKEALLSLHSAVYKDAEGEKDSLARTVAENLY